MDIAALRKSYERDALDEADAPELPLASIYGITSFELG